MAFKERLEEMQSLHDSKNADYGASTDPYQNFRGSEDFGVPAWVGAIIRSEDKHRRMQEFVKKGKLNNESVRDSLLDNAIYAVIALDLYDEATAEPAPEKVVKKTRCLVHQDGPCPGWEQELYR